MSDIESKIKTILTKAYLSGSRPIDRQPCDITDVWIQSDLTTILALIAADRAGLVEALKTISELHEDDGFAMQDIAISTLKEMSK